jgi:hypothetical protein
MKKILLCDGDSWTAGDIVDPEIFGDRKEEVNNPKNRPYRLPKVWPHKLGKLLDIEVENIARSASSNDAIVRRVLRKVLELLENYNGKEIFVIIGWTSPERKDFYYKGDWSSWETLYPAQFEQSFRDVDLNKFYEIYLKKFWNKEEYTERYIQQNLLLHHFLNSHNIEHLFFDAFYEENGGMFQDIEIQDEMESSFLTDEYLNIRKKIFKKESFRNYILKRNLMDGIHPNETGHEVWAIELYNSIKDKI